MNRRRFLQAAGLSLFIPAVTGMCQAGRSGADRVAADYFFFDDRFEVARRLAAGWPGSAAPTAVRGDVTEIWRSRLAHVCLDSPLVTCGITTESFPFCLKIMLAEKSPVETQITRIDRDLYSWTIRSGGAIKRGSLS